MRNFTKVPELQKPRAPRNSPYKHKCSQCEKQPATAGCEVYTSCTMTKQASLSLHCSQAKVTANGHLAHGSTVQE